MDRYLLGARVIGYHCTRLADDELLGVQQDGLRVLHGAATEARIRARVAAGDLTEAIGRQVLAAHYAEHDGSQGFGTRKGMLWFVATRTTLAESGVGHFFENWGGEAIYAPHLRNPGVKVVLERIGSACVVEFSVPVADVETFCSVGERLLRWYLERRGTPTEHEGDWEGYSRAPIPGSAVREVHRDGEPWFVEMTRRI